MTAQFTSNQVLNAVRQSRPGNPVAAVHDDMACFCEYEPWFVFFDSEDATPDRLMFDGVNQYDDNGDVDYVRVVMVQS